MIIIPGAGAQTQQPIILSSRHRQFNARIIVHSQQVVLDIQLSVHRRYIDTDNISQPRLINRDHSFPRHVEFWAELRNLPVAAEFLCYRGILRNSVLDTNKGTKYGTFWSFSGGHTVCNRDFAMKYMTADWAVTEGIFNYWSELIWNIPSLFGRHLYFSVAVTGDKYCIFVRVQGAIKINYNIWKICRGEPRNLANWPAEFGKICRGKLWSLLININIIIIIISPMTMFIVLPSWQAIVRVLSVHAMNSAQRQVAADLWTKSTDLSHRPTYKW